MQLKQTDIYFNRSIYIIESTGIRLVKKGISESSETFIDLEDVGTKIIKKQSKQIVWLILSVLFFALGIFVFYNRMTGGKVGQGAEIFHFSTCTIFMIIFLVTRKDIVFLAQADNSNAIKFSASTRQKKEVDKFIEELLTTRNAYLLNKYATVDTLMPYDQQYNALIWLYNIQLLSKEQLQSKIDELDRLNLAKGVSTEGAKKVIGFKLNNTTEDDE